MANSRAKLGLIVVAVLAVARFVGMPLLEWQADTRADVERLQKNLQRLDNLAAREAELQQVVAKLSTSQAPLTARYFSNIPNNRLQLTVQQRIERLAQQHQVALNATSWAAPITGELTRLPLQINVLAPWPKLQAFLQAIEQQPKLHALRQMHLRRDNNRGSGWVSADLQVVVYTNASKVVR